jgi:hypothetical protein
MSNYGIKISKDGVDVRDAEPKDLLVSSEYDTFKIHHTGMIELTAPQVTIESPYEVPFYSGEYVHNLGYKPFTLPYIQTSLVTPTPVEYSSDGSTYVHTPTADYDLNDIASVIMLEDPPTEPLIYAKELFRLVVTNTRIILYMGRFCRNIFNPVRFEEMRATLYFTTFYNQVDSELDLV